MVSHTCRFCCCF